MLRAAILILLMTGCAPARESTYAAHGADWFSVSPWSFC